MSKLPLAVAILFALVIGLICASANAASASAAYEYRLCETDRTVSPIKWSCGDWTTDQPRLVDYITLMRDTVFVYTIEERVKPTGNQ